MESLKIAFNVVTSPFTGFKMLKEKKTFLLPFILTILITSGGMAYYSFNVDARYVLSKQMESSGVDKKFPKEKLDEIIEKQSKIMKYSMPIAVAVATPIYMLIFALYLFIMAKIYTSDLTFKESFAILANSYFVYFFWGIALFLVLLFTDFKTTTIQNLMPTNLGYFFPAAKVGKKMFVILNKIDIFNLWYLSLSAIGFSIMAEEGLVKSFLTVFVPVIILVAVSILLI